MEPRYTNRAKLFDIRGKLLVGIISYDEAKAAAEPVIAEMNASGTAIAKKHGKRFKPFTFTQFMR